MTSENLFAKPTGTIRVRVLRGVGYRGQSLEAGREYEVEAEDGELFIRLGKAVRV